MLTNTFCHISGVANKTERNLWKAGVTSWDSGTQQLPVWLPRRLRASWGQHIQESMSNYEKRNAGYFAEQLPMKEHWRLYRDFQDSCAFVDIETTGLYDSEITTIVLYDGRTIRYYINGDNLDRFCEEVEKYALLVTYNGKSFDVPFIKRHFHVQLPQAHIDLRYPLWSLGLRGGLKGCEQQLGIGRPGLEGLGGRDALLLWHYYREEKNVKALETLLAYNIQDTLTLHTLMVHTYNEKVKATPFAGNHSLSMPAPPKGPLEPDRDTVERVFRDRVILSPAECRVPCFRDPPRPHASFDCQSGRESIFGTAGGSEWTESGEHAFAVPPSSEPVSFP